MMIRSVGHRTRHRMVPPTCQNADSDNNSVLLLACLGVGMKALSYHTLFLSSYTQELFYFNHGRGAGDGERNTYCRLSSVSGVHSAIFPRGVSRTNLRFFLPLHPRQPVSPPSRRATTRLVDSVR